MGADGSLLSYVMPLERHYPTWLSDQRVRVYAALTVGKEGGEIGPIETRL